jgi:hypothetical protein
MTPIDPQDNNQYRSTAGAIFAAHARAHAYAEAVTRRYQVWRGDSVEKEIQYLTDAQVIAMRHVGYYVEEDGKAKS